MTVTETTTEALNVDCLLRQLRGRIEEQEERAQAAERYAAQVEAENERMHSVRELVAQGSTILDDLSSWQSVRTTSLAQTTAENALREAKAIDLPSARERLDAVITDATMAGYAEGAVTGKNAEQRKVELDAYLAGQEPVLVAREHLRSTEAELVALESEVAVADAEHKAALGRWYAARSASELMAAMLVAVAGK